MTVSDSSMQKKTRNSTKGPIKKHLIFETAITLFQERGFEQTTMRDVAAECDMALGNAYYYYSSKEHFIFALYEKTLTAQVLACEKALEENTQFKARLAIALKTNIEVLLPYHDVLKNLFRLIADPNSEFNPFGPGSAHIRQGAQSIYQRVVEGSKDKMRDSVREGMPKLLWLTHMAVVFYWLHDRSLSQKKTNRLIELLCELLGALITILNLPLTEKLWLLMLELIEEIEITIDSRANS